VIYSSALIQKGGKGGREERRKKGRKEGRKEKTDKWKKIVSGAFNDLFICPNTNTIY
jgi:hypothetical protein